MYFDSSTIISCYSGCSSMTGPAPSKRCDFYIVLEFCLLKPSDVWLIPLLIGGRGSKSGGLFIFEMLLLFIGELAVTSRGASLFLATDPPPVPLIGIKFMKEEVKVELIAFVLTIGSTGWKAAF